MTPEELTPRDMSKPSVEERIIPGGEGFADALERGEDISKRFTCRKDCAESASDFVQREAGYSVFGIAFIAIGLLAAVALAVLLLEDASEWR